MLKIFGPSKKQLIAEKQEAEDLLKVISAQLLKAQEEQEALVSALEEKEARMTKIKAELSVKNSVLARVKGLDAAQTAQALVQLGKECQQGEARLKAKLAELEHEVADAEALTEKEREKRNQELKELDSKIWKKKSELISLTDQEILESYSFYSYDHPASNSLELGDELAEVARVIKEMIKDKSAMSAATGFLFDNDAKKGARFVDDMKRLGLRAYNIEAENAVKATKSGNSATMLKRLETSKAQIERIGKFINLRVDEDYHELRLQEIDLAYRKARAVEQEKALEAERRAELREQAKIEAEIKKKREARERELRRIRQEFEQAQREAEAHKRALLDKEKSHYENVLESEWVREDEEALEKLKAQMTEVESAIDDLNLREANVSAGYVYVLSNEGAFGKDIVKIGMTRRLDPIDRVKELSGASVPFVFDHHMLVFSQNARELEHKLHEKFAERRVNLVNPRKEYFYVTPRAVLEAMKEFDATVTEFNENAPASEYHESEELRANLA